ncbi:Transcriptional regulator CRZ1 [Pichia kudriavzevii]|uniref:Transcriptional regulator CRZ1 n=1 Tax=Pichia kudriavzevii TaxID=4909 RepID=A0A1V2LS75_PICKU|nr:Transcriptional regulator CRZ1 [Pichia kudriavzevii]
MSESTSSVERVARIDCDPRFQRGEDAIKAVQVENRDTTARDGLEDQYVRPGVGASTNDNADNDTNDNDNADNENAANTHMQHTSDSANYFLQKEDRILNTNSEWLNNISIPLEPTHSSHPSSPAATSPAISKLIHSINNPFPYGIVNSNTVGISSSTNSNYRTTNSPFSKTVSHTAQTPTTTDIILDQPHVSFSQQYHQKPPNKIFICHFPGCQKTFSRKLNFVSHYQSTHEHQKPFQCETCHKEFARHSDRRRHEKSQHSQSKDYICAGIAENGMHWGCGRKFKRKDGLTAHWKSIRARKKCFANIPNSNPLPK